MNSTDNTIESELYEALFPEKAQSLREALAIGEQLVKDLKSFNEFLAIDIWGEPVVPVVSVKATHIGTITHHGRFYSVRVLANYGHEVISVCTRESEQEAIAFTEGKYAVEWVLPNRFQQEVACCR